MNFFDILDETMGLVEKDGKEEEEWKWLRNSDSSSTFLDETTPASTSEDEELSARDSEWEDENRADNPGYQPGVVARVDERPRHLLQSMPRNRN